MFPQFTRTLIVMVFSPQRGSLNVCSPSAPRHSSLPLLQRMGPAQFLYVSLTARVVLEGDRDGTHFITAHIRSRSARANAARAVAVVLFPRTAAFVSSTTMMAWTSGLTLWHVHRLEH